MKLQTNTMLALYSVLEFAADPARHIPASQIAQKYGVSAHHLAKVLADLTRAGLIASVRGVGGGYRFVGNARRTTLLDVIQIFEDLGPNAAVRGEDRAELAIDRAMDAVLSEIDEMARATFGSITLSTMLRLIERHEGTPQTAVAAAGFVEAEV